MTAIEPDVAEIVRQRLQTDLRAALRERDMLSIGTLRCLIAAIDNAGAIPIAPGSAAPQHEVARRRLDHSEVQTLLRNEYDARQAAADGLSHLGLDAKAEEARFEAAIVDRYLAAAPLSGG